jgi:predicted dehydrogenase
MTMKPLKLCLVGLGRVAKSHMEGINELDGLVEVVCAVNRGREKGEAFCRDFGISKFYSSIGEALINEDFEAVDLCLPNHLHRDVTVECLNAGKHALVEKPMANTVEECLDMNEAARRNNRVLMVGQSRRFYDAVFASKAAIDSGADGRLISVNAQLAGYLPKAPTPWWNSISTAGGLMIPIWGNHIIDYIIWAFEGIPKRVYCESYSVNPTWEGEDEVALTMGYDDERFASIRMSWNARFSDEVWDGTGKMLSSKDIFYQRTMQMEKATYVLDDETRLSRNGRVVIEDDGAMSNFARQTHEFVSAIRERRKPIGDGEDIINVIRVQEAALESASAHRMIELY